MRKLATIRKISKIVEIPDADAIVCAYVDGWPVVVSKDTHHVGETVVYIEPDAWVPHNLAPYLSKGTEPRDYNGVLGARLRSIKLRKQLSQGLVLHLQPIIDTFAFSNASDTRPLDEVFHEGADISDILNIQKWEAPIPACLAGEVRGMFPSFIPKTDQERIQNLLPDLDRWNNSTPRLEWEVTEKLEGSSMTVYWFDGEFGVCSRNLNLKPSNSNTLWQVATALSLEQKLIGYGRHIALQGELIGEGIEGNIYKLKGHHFRLYDVYDIDNRCYLSSSQRQQLAFDLNIPHVPIIDKSFMLHNTTCQQLLDMADGRSDLRDTAREGLVFKSTDGSCSFKAISNKYLLNQR